MIYLFLADGFEETEAIGTADVLMRAGLNVKLVGVTGKNVKGSHGINIESDLKVEDISLNDSLEGVVLPGGMPGTLNLEKSEAVKEAIMYAYENGKITAAICAAPSILGHMGILKGKNATCFPGFEDELIGANVTGNSVSKDGNVITGNGPGSSLKFGKAIIETFIGKEKADKILEGMQVK